MAGTEGYEYEHDWEMERVRLAGLESALDPGTCEHLTRLGVGVGTRCLEVGAGGGSVVFWLADRVAPGGVVVATDLETGFLESAAPDYPALKVLTLERPAAAARPQASRQAAGQAGTDGRSAAARVHAP